MSEALVQRLPDGRWRAELRDDQGRRRARLFTRGEVARRWVDQVHGSQVAATDPTGGEVDGEAAGAYPLSCEPVGDDRFSLKLLAELAALLEAHGYPRPRSAGDFLRLQECLHRVLYGAGAR